MPAAHPFFKLLWVANLATVLTERPKLYFPGSRHIQGDIWVQRSRHPHFPHFMRFQLFIPPELDKVQMISRRRIDRIERSLSCSSMIRMVQSVFPNIQGGWVAGDEHIWTFLADHPGDIPPQRQVWHQITIRMIQEANPLYAQYFRSSLLFPLPQLAQLLRFNTAVLAPFIPAG